MEGLCDDLLGQIMERVSDDRDRKSSSEVCKLWYTAEALTRVRVRVQHPEQIPNFLVRFSNLTTLVVGAAISDQTLVFVSRTFPKLRTLDLSFDLSRWVCDPPVVDFGDEGLSAVASGCCDLREVLLRGRLNVGDGGIIDLQRKARNLTALDLSECSLMTEKSIEAAAGMGSLSRLYLRYCPQVTDRGLDFLSKGPASKSIRVLDISFCLRISDVGVCCLKRLSFLEELGLCGCGPTELTDAVAVAVASVSSLRKLDISMQMHITDMFISTVVGMGSLSELYIRNCPLVTDHGLDMLSSGLAARRLRVLDISYCERITDVGVSGLKRLSCLEDLMLYGCGCGELTDVAGVAVASISSLRKLDLSRQNHITNATLFAVASNCRDLVEICLRHCKGTMDQGILNLASRLPLETIRMPHLDYLGKFSPFYLAEIAEQCLSLRLLVVDYGMKKWFSSSQLDTLSGVCKLVFGCERTYGKVDSSAYIT